MPCVRRERLFYASAPGAIWRQAQTSLKRSEMGLLALPDVVLVGNRPVKAG